MGQSPLEKLTAGRTDAQMNKGSTPDHDGAIRGSFDGAGSRCQRRSKLIDLNDIGPLKYIHNIRRHIKIYHDGIQAHYENRFI